MVIHLYTFVKVSHTSYKLQKKTVNGDLILLHGLSVSLFIMLCLRSIRMEMLSVNLVFKGKFYIGIIGK